MSLDKHHIKYLVDVVFGESNDLINCTIKISKDMIDIGIYLL